MARTPDYDTQILDDIARRLKATHHFGSVMRDYAPGHPTALAAPRPLALVGLTQADEGHSSRLGGGSALDAAEARPAGDGWIDRAVKLQIVICHSDEQVDRRSQTVRTLEMLARDTVDGRSLAGLTFPDWTFLGPAKPMKGANEPEEWWAIDGTASYLIDGYQAHTAP